MMANKLILVALILCVGSSVHSLKLNDICNYGVIEYNGLEVNSFYTLPEPQQVSLDPNKSFAIFNQKIIYLFLSNQINIPSLGTFTFNETEAYFPDDYDQLEFDSIKRNHTDKVVKLLSEKYLNNFSKAFFSKFEGPRVVFNELYARLNNLKNNHMKSSNVYRNQYRISALTAIQKIMRQTLDFIEVLEDFFELYDLPQMTISRFGIKEEKEMEKLSALIHNQSLSNENQTMVFDNVKIDHVYEEGIVVASNFTLNRDSSEPNNVLKSTGALYYKVVLPFHNKNYPTTYPRCTSTYHLPRFFYSHFKS